MVNRFRTILLLAVLAAAGCKNEDRYLRVNPLSVELESHAEYALVEVEASASWMSYSNADWLQSYMQDSRTLRIQIQLANETLEDRSTEVSIITGDALTYTLPVIQLAADVRLSVSPDSALEFGSKGAETYVLTVTADIPGTEGWTFASNEEWLTIVRGENGDSDKLTVTADESRSLDERIDTVYVMPANGAYTARTVKIPVVQRAAGLIVVPGEGFTMTDGRVDIAADAVEVALSVYATDSWTVATDDTENRLVLNMTGGPADTQDGALLTINAPANTSAGEYSYLLTFTCAGENYEYRLVQAAP